MAGSYWLKEPGGQLQGTEESANLLQLWGRTCVHSGAKESVQKKTYIFVHYCPVKVKEIWTPKPQATNLSA
jgi:hypothetical protein